MLKRRLALTSGHQRIWRRRKQQQAAASSSKQGRRGAGQGRTAAAGGEAKRRVLPQRMRAAASRATAPAVRTGRCKTDARVIRNGWRRGEVENELVRERVFVDGGTGLFRRCYVLRVPTAGWGTAPVAEHRRPLYVTPRCQRLIPSKIPRRSWATPIDSKVSTCRSRGTEQASRSQ